MKYDGILIASDVDGTLARGVEVSKENIEAIRYFTENGGLFTLSTGRAYRYVSEHFENVLSINAPLIVVNGTQIVDQNDGKVLWQGAMPESFKEALCVAKATCPDLDVYVHTPTGETVTTFDPADYATGEFLKIVFVADSHEKVKALKATLEPKFPEFEMGHSWEVSLELNSRLAGKGHAVRMVKEMTNAKTVIGVGDYGNDFSLLSDADIGIAVGNAMPGLKEIADFVTVPMEKHAIAHIIYHLDEFIKD